MHMFKKLILIFLLAGGLIACNDQADTKSDATEEHTHHEGHDHDGHDHGDANMEEGDGVHFGETISEEGAIPFDALLVKMNDTDSLDAKVMGTVESVCQAKGCWMNIQSAEGQEMFVQFKDYGFFMPKDIAGREVIMDGYAYRETTSVEELRHYAADEGLSQEEIDAITEPKEELKFLASGVILVPQNQQ